MSRDIDNMQDTLDSRDIIERIESLEEDAENWAEEHPEADFYATEEGEELRTLSAIMDDCKGNGGDEQWRGDWYPVTLIRESYFEEAMDEMIKDCYELPEDLPFWMTISYDYDALKQDYTEVDFGGVTYYVR